MYRRRANSLNKNTTKSARLIKTFKNLAMFLCPISRIQAVRNCKTLVLNDSSNLHFCKMLWHQISSISSIHWLDKLFSFFYFSVPVDLSSTKTWNWLCSYVGLIMLTAFINHSGNSLITFNRNLSLLNELLILFWWVLLSLGYYWHLSYHPHPQMLNTIEVISIFKEILVYWFLAQESAIWKTG